MTLFTSIVSICLFIIFAALYDKSALFNGDSYLIAFFQIVFLVPTLATILDLFGFAVIKRAIGKFQDWVFRYVFRILNGKDWR